MRSGAPRILEEMKRLPSPAMAVALVALGVALGGTGVAATSGLITGADIKNHSVSLNDLTYSAIKQLRGRRGPPGPAGKSVSLAGKLMLRQAQTTLGPGSIGSATATCPVGTVALSGGAHTTGTTLWASEPTASGSSLGWLAGATASAGLQAEVDAYVICFSP
jgi:hypothetical protein